MGQLDRLRELTVDWDGYGAKPMRPEVVDAARRVLLSIASAPIETPRIVPMSRGRLQFEWHNGSRTLELEFASETDLHYLNWDDATGLSEEEVIPADDMVTVDRLITWFLSE